MSEAIIKKDGTDYPIQTMPLHYPADRVYLDGDTSKNVQDATSKSSDLAYGTSLNGVKESGLYYCDGVIDSPLGTNQWCFLLVIASRNKSSIKQIAYSNDGSESWERHYRNSTWSAWTLL